MNVESIGTQLGSTHPWEQRADGWWLVEPELDVKRMAALMLGLAARLVTITARPAPGGECRLAYHWDLEDELLNLVTSTHNGSIYSIAAICPAADWIEREIHDYFAVDFVGREEGLDPLVLRPGDSPGLFQWNGQKGGEQ
jgi:hypothetical protein